jgi:hypothetical protein
VRIVVSALLSLLLGIVSAQPTFAGEKGDFKKAQHLGTVEAYTDFLKKHPSGKLADEAAVLLEQAEYQEAVKGDRLGLYQRFLDHFPKSPQVEDIKARMQLASEQLGAVTLGKSVLIDLGAGVPNSADRPERRLIESLKSALAKNGFDIASPGSGQPDVQIKIGEIGGTIPAGIAIFSVDLERKRLEPSQVNAYYSVPVTVVQRTAGPLMLGKSISGGTAAGAMWGGQAEIQRLDSLAAEIEKEVTKLFGLFSAAK